MGAESLVTDPLTAARRLLGARLTAGGVDATIVEVEAYGGPPDGPWPDPGSHSFRGPNGRNVVMFGAAGRLYTYRSHGIHVCANVVCGPDGTAAAVLLRAAVVDHGIERARARRGAVVADRARSGLRGRSHNGHPTDDAVFSDGTRSGRTVRRRGTAKTA